MKAIMLAPVSYLRSLVVGAVHRHRTGVGSIPAGGPIVDEFFSTVPGSNFDMCIIFPLDTTTHLPFRKFKKMPGFKNLHKI